LAERWSGLRRAFADARGDLADAYSDARVGRLDLGDRGEDLKARVRPGWFGASVAWLCFILAFWAFIGAFTLPSVFYGQELSRDHLLWTLSWIAMLALICYVSGDYVVRETLVFAGGKLTLKRNYLVFVLTESFRAEEVRDLRAVGPDNGTVEFEAGGRTRRLRTRLEERDSRKLVGELRRHLNS